MPPELALFFMLPLLLSSSLTIEADQDISGSLNASDSDLNENAIRSGHEVIFKISLKMVFSPFLTPPGPW